MRLTHSLASVLFAVTLSLTPSLFQDDGPDKPVGEQGYPWDRVGSKKSEELFEKLLGAWQLTNIVSARLNTVAREETGVLLITRDYASFELHIGWKEPQGGLQDWQFQSGTHKIAIDAQLRMHLTSVISAAFDQEGDLQFIPPGTTRSYRVETAPERLVLTRVDTSDRFIFRRMPNPSLDKDKDIFGREKSE